MQPAERDAMRRRKLLDAALEQVGRDGFNGMTIEGVCRAAGVTHRNFYDLFADREELFMALYDELTQAGQAAVAAAVAEAPGDFAGQAHAGVDAAMHAFADDPKVARVVLIEVHGISPRVERQRREAIDGFAAFVTAVVDGFARPASPPPRQLAIRAVALVGAIVELLVRRTAHQDEEPLDELVEEVVRLFLLAFGEPPEQ
jgi:AcrR family transcriptional regulator